MRNTVSFLFKEKKGDSKNRQKKCRKRIIKSKGIFSQKKFKKDNKNEETKEKQMFKKENKKGSCSKTQENKNKQRKLFLKKKEDREKGQTCKNEEICKNAQPESKKSKNAEVPNTCLYKRS